MAKNYYEILGVSKTCTEDELKKAFRKLAIETHPDKHPGDKKAEEKFKEINEAYTVLSDHDKRAHYDEELNNPFASTCHASFRSQSNQADFDAINDMFSKFFGGSPFSFNETSFSSNSFSSQTKENLDINLNLVITFEEAYCGCKKNIVYDFYTPCETCNGLKWDKTSKLTKCKACNGKGYFESVRNSFFGPPQVVRTQCKECNGSGTHYEKVCSACHGAGTQRNEKKLTINIPPGSYNNMTLRVAGGGNISAQTNTAGNLFIKITTSYESADNKFKRDDEFNLLTTLFLSYYELVSGTTKTIVLPDGSEKTFKIPENIKLGDTLKIKNCGFKILSGAISSQTNGNLLIEIQLKPTGKLSKEQLELLKKFDEKLNSN